MVRSLIGMTILGLAVACARDTTGPSTAAPTPAVLTWIADSAHRIATFDPAASDTDLAPLGRLVGSARLVGLGEATHGSHEFFAIKHRALRYLVEHDGFTGFALEASMPEAFALDHYVRTGEGDPVLLLANLHFWTWYNHELLDLVKWMRSYNAARPASLQIGFYGFDMQFPAVALDSVVAFTARVSPSIGARVTGDYQCITPYINVGATFPANYSKASPSVRAACQQALADVRLQITSNEATLVSASSAGSVAFVLQMARVVEQWEEAMRNGQVARFRDADMAENLEWLIGHTAAGARLVVSAHDQHIQRDESVPSMGAVLAHQTSIGYVAIGTAFDSGSFNAVRQDATSGRSLGIQAMTAPRADAGTVEGAFAKASNQNFLIDLRSAPPGAARAWLDAHMAMREIGATYVPEAPEHYWVRMTPAAEFDALMFIPIVTASSFLP